MRDVKEKEGGGLMILYKNGNILMKNRNHAYRYFNYQMSNLWFGNKDDFNLHVSFQL